MTRISHNWGATSEERQLPLPCDHVITHSDDTLFRAITIHARCEVVFRWLCQLRVAPYSYDVIDNWGRRSPQQLTPGLEQLIVGQTIMTIFELVDFVYNQQLTIRMKEGTRARKVFGDVCGTYFIRSMENKSCRLLVKLLVSYPKGLPGAAMRRLLPWGDVIMMRRQLLNLKTLAEASGANLNF